MLLVLNEWVFHDLLGENGCDAFRETAEFLISFARSNDGLVIPAEERWNDKAFRLMRIPDPLVRQLSQLFHRLMRDSNRAIRVATEGIGPIEEDLREQTPAEDLYLVLAYISSGADLLVTTDEKLHSALTQQGDVNCRMRDDFLPSYPQGDRH